MARTVTNTAVTGGPTATISDSTLRYRGAGNRAQRVASSGGGAAGGGCARGGAGAICMRTSLVVWEHTAGVRSSEGGEPP